MKTKKEIRQAVYDKYGGHCAYCGRPLAYKDMQVDHIVSKYSSRYTDPADIDVLTNYNPACRACNFRKGTLSLEGFRREIKEQAKREMLRFQARMSVAFGLLEYHPEREITFYFEQYDTNSNNQ